jgi:hypothetical protein
LIGVGLLARAKDGMAPKWVRRVVEAVVMPRLLRMGGVWFCEESVSKELLAVQRAAACLITGGYRTTSLAALKVEANLLPHPLRLRAFQH